MGDYFSKWKEAYPVPDHTALTVADKLLTEFICRFGCPLSIHSDQGREFQSQLFQILCEKLGIQKTRSTPYRPQSSGLVERFNRTLKQMLSMFVNTHRNDWDDHIPYLMMAYRSTVHAMLGREVHLPSGYYVWVTCWGTRLLPYRICGVDQKYYERSILFCPE